MISLSYRGRSRWICRRSHPHHRTHLLLQTKEGAGTGAATVQTTEPQ